MKLDKKLLAILLFAFILWIWNIGAADLVSDEALYSFRALGWHDYLATDGQTTPFQWFGQIPWWANLSFHDAPPLVFGVQKIFFVIFGDNPFGARLPFVLAMAATLYFVFFDWQRITFKKGWLPGLFFNGHNVIRCLWRSGWIVRRGGGSIYCAGHTFLG